MYTYVQKVVKQRVLMVFIPLLLEPSCFLGNIEIRWVISFFSGITKDYWLSEFSGEYSTTIGDQIVSQTGASIIET